MPALSETDQKRITFLSLLSSAVSLDGDPYQQATSWLSDMEDDGFFERGGPAPTSGRRQTSSRQASPSRSQTRGGGGGYDKPYSGQPLRDPGGEPTDRQVAKVFTLTKDYSEDELYSMTKQEVSDLIANLS